MKRRCSNPKQTNWKYYGGRGIKVCARWEKYDNFLADMGHRPHDMTLDRIDGDGDYEPANCCWATAVKQIANSKVTKYEITARGQTLTAAQWARELKIPPYLIYQRLRRGLTGEDLFAPVLSWKECSNRGVEAQRKIRLARKAESHVPTLLLATFAAP